MFIIYLPASAPVAHPVPLRNAAARKRKPRPGKAGRRAGYCSWTTRTCSRNSSARCSTHLGYEVVCAANGEEALARYAECGQPFDAVIVDLTVPGGMGGYEAVQRLRVTLTREVRAIVSSGYSNDPADDELPGARVLRGNRQAVPDGRIGQGTGRGDRYLKVGTALLAVPICLPKVPVSPQKSGTARRAVPTCLLADLPDVDVQRPVG